MTKKTKNEDIEPIEDLIVEEVPALDAEPSDAEIVQVDSTDNDPQEELAGYSLDEVPKIDNGDKSTDEDDAALMVKGVQVMNEELGMDENLDPRTDDEFLGVLDDPDMNDIFDEKDDWN